MKLEEKKEEPEWIIEEPTTYVQWAKGATTWLGKAFDEKPLTRPRSM